MTPYPYQQKIFDAVRSKLMIKKHLLLSAPCAAGKTFIFSMLAKWLHKKGRNVMVLLDRTNLVTQTADKLREYLGNPFPDPVGIACATAQKEKQMNHPITVASRQTLTPILDSIRNMKYSLLIIDEAHLCNPVYGQYHDIIAALKAGHPDMRVFGCTATPYRMTGYIYGSEKLFSELDFRITAKELTEKGYIVPLRWKCRLSDVTDQLAKLKPGNNGELKESEQFEIIGQPVFVESVFQKWKEHCIGRKTAVFALNIAHAEKLHSVFRENGAEAWVIHSKQEQGITDGHIADFRKSGNGVIINVGILTVGSDIPDMTAIMLARKTMSPGLFFQIVGRGARKFPGKTDCLVVDLCGNYMQHGRDPDNPIIQADKKADDLKYKLCPMCEELVKLSAAVCPICGFAFPEPEHHEKFIAETEKAGMMVDLDKELVICCDRIKYGYYKKPEKSLPTVWAKFIKNRQVVASKWFCPEHKGFPRKQFENYWNEMWGTPPAPATVKEFLARADELSPQAQIKVDLTRGEYPDIIEIKNILFDTENSA